MYTFNILKNNFNDISYISSDESVIELYNEYGDGFHSHIDGQFLLIVRDGYHLNFFTDPWGSTVRQSGSSGFDGASTGA